MSRVFLATALALIVGIGILRLLPASAALPSLHVGAWALLALLAVTSALARRTPTKTDNLLVVGALAASTALMVRFGRYECWTFFQTLCGSGGSEHSGWNAVFVNGDTFSYIEPFTSTSVRPPLYYWFMRAASSFAAHPPDFNAKP